MADTTKAAFVCKLIVVCCFCIVNYIQVIEACFLCVYLL